MGTGETFFLSLLPSVQSEWSLALIIVASTFVLEDPTTLAVGYLIQSHRISEELGLAALFLGIFLGDLGLYLLGACVKRGLFKGRSWSFVPTTLEVFLARFIPGMRTITFSAAGFFGSPVRNFVLVGAVSSFLWTLLILSSTRWIFRQLELAPWWVWALAGLTLMGTLRLVGLGLRRYVDGRRARHEGSR